MNAMVVKTRLSLEECKARCQGKAHGGMVIARSGKVKDGSFKFYVNRNPGGWRETLQLGVAIKGSVRKLPEGGCEITYDYYYGWDPRGLWIKHTLIWAAVLWLVAKVTYILPAAYDHLEYWMWLAGLAVVTGIEALINVPLTKKQDAIWKYGSNLDHWVKSELCLEEFQRH